MNILFCSNWRAFSAYAQQAQLFVRRMIADGHKVTVLELAGSQGRVYEQDGVTVLPIHFDPLGQDVVVNYAAEYAADVVITLMDVWRYDPSIWRQVHWWAWTPLDHQPVPPGVANALQGASGVIAMSRYGQKQLQDAGIPAYYVPLAVDTSVFKPLPQSEARAEVNMPDDVFWVTFVGVNDSNPSRKGIPELLMAWQIFSQRHPDAILYLHTGVTGNLAINGIGGVHVDILMRTLAINPATVRVVDQHRYRTGMSQREVMLYYAAADVVVLPSRGEGFGMPLIEAQAVGTPVITTDFAAGAELVVSGWCAPYIPEWTLQSAMNAKVDVDGLVSALEQAYQMRGNQALREAAIAGVEHYAIDHVYAHAMRPLLDTMAISALERMKTGAV